MNKPDILIASYDAHYDTLDGVLNALANGEEFAVLEPFTRDLRGSRITKDDLMSGAAFRQKIDKVFVRYNSGQSMFLLDV